MRGLQSEVIYVVIYTLQPGTHLVPHVGKPNQLVFQLGLVCPGKALLRVGDYTHEYTEGAMLAFEDAWEHELTYENEDSNEQRVVFAATLNMNEQVMHHEHPGPHAWHREL